MLRSLLLLLALVPLLAWGFEDRQLAIDAAQYQRFIQQSRAPAQAPQGELDTMLALGRAERLAMEGQWNEAVRAYEELINFGQDGPQIWLRLALAWRSQALDEDRVIDRGALDRALEAAYRALEVSAGNDAQRSRVLFALGELLERADRPRDALAVYREGLAIERDTNIASRAEALAEQLAFRLAGNDVETEGAEPRICLEFTAPLAQDRGLRYEDYLALEPSVELSAAARDQRLCLQGIDYGRDYQITVRPGVPAADGSRLEDGQTFTVTVPDREPVLGFRGNGYVLPRAGLHSLPLVSVNLDRAIIELFRVDDRNLISQLHDGRLLAPLDEYSQEYLADTGGARLWAGELTIASRLNEEVTTAIPLDQFLPDTRPGVYAVTARQPDQDHGRSATQWLVVSDLGLYTLQGADGLGVFVRSLASAGPVAGVELTLYARNNSELGRATTDRQGRATFEPGLLRGEGGQAPMVLMAQGKDDFNFIDLSRPAFDLSDRGVAGRAPPGAVDAYLYTERGVYRPGETVQLTVLARDAQGRALTDLPLVLKLFRPDGVEARRLTLSEGQLGGFAVPLDLPATARTGNWTARVWADPNAQQPAGEVSFLVEDFVPQQLRLTLTSPAEALTPDGPVTVNVEGEFLYGAPGADLRTQAELVLREDPRPFPAWEGYRFGLIQEEWSPTRRELPIPPTDGQGHTRVVADLESLPATSRPLRAEVRVSLFEPGGRPVSRSLTLPVRGAGLALGILPAFDALDPGQAPAFEVVALDDQGNPRPAPGLRAELVREEAEYYWYQREGRWDYRLILRDSEPVWSAPLDLAGEPQPIQGPGLEWGRYRLEVHDPAGGAATSVRFQVGWWVEPAGADTPDRLQLTLDQDRYRAGDTARVFIQAPFAGQALLTVLDDRLRQVRTLELPADGTTVDLPVSDDWGPGVYVTATAFRPGQGSDNERGPSRAVGLAWLGLDSTPRTLEVTIGAPEEVLPRQRVEIPVTVAGAGAGEAVFLTLAAVDEGILQLTDFATPDPLAHLWGQRRLGVEIRDLYGRLIEPGGEAGQLRSGGDAASRQLGGPGVKTVETVALFQGPLAVGDDGRASVPLTLPDFNGELRLMAVAWSRQRLGRAQEALLVRDPLVARLYLPRFLAPGDTADITLELHNLNAPAGDYRVGLSAGGAVNVPEAGGFGQSLETGQRLTRRYTLAGLEPGVGTLELTVQGPEGSDLNLTRQWQIAVRPAQGLITRQGADRLEPGGSLTLNQTLLDGLLTGESQVDLTLASRPALDVPGLLAQLDRYPYGCLEQITSRALPLLYFDEIAAGWPGVEPQARLRGRVQDGVERILGLQQASGGFGLWRSEGETQQWLSAYALDFLTRAREAGLLVPDSPYQRGLDWLAEQLAREDYEPPTLAARAYGLYVLTRAGQVAVGDLRYLHDNHLERLPTRLAKAQLGAALARQGDTFRARQALQAAIDHDQRPPRYHQDYGTELRDLAGLVALIGEAGLLTEAIPNLALELAGELTARRYTSTQEQAWLLLAARSLPAGDGLTVTLNGQPPMSPADPLHLTLLPEELAAGFTVTNQGQGPVWSRYRVSGIPNEPLPPVQEGFAITRRYYTPDGRAVAADQIQRFDSLVALITGRVEEGQDHRALIVDLLPAGLEIENPRLAGGREAGELAWLPQLSETDHVEARDDRFVAALTLDEGQDFATAYRLRAVTPGTFQGPAVFIEDMYRPWYRGRGALETVTVTEVRQP